MIRKFVVLSRFVSCKLRFGQALLCKEVRISIASWRNLCLNQTLEPEVSNFTSFGELTGLDVCCGKYSKHPQKGLKSKKNADILSTPEAPLNMVSKSKLP